MEIDYAENASAAEHSFPLLVNIPNIAGDVPDWSYKMRREMQEIVDGLFLGPYSVAVRSKVKSMNCFVSLSSL